MAVQLRNGVERSLPHGGAAVAEEELHAAGRPGQSAIHDQRRRARVPPSQHAALHRWSAVRFG